ncbi:glycogen debranching enzyme [Lachnospiraceae bacterium KM106-2]|nr:glycogen debranching enzyme [Lachnospiraceae bacterium KM106-2]
MQTITCSGAHLYPLDVINEFKVRPGFFLQNGAIAIPGGVSFTVYSRRATSCELVLFKRGEKEPYAVIPIPEGYRIGFVYSIIVFELDIGEFEYAYRLDGPYDPKKGLLFDQTKLLLDPYAKAVTGQSVWGKRNDYENGYRARVVSNDFDWGNDKQPEIPLEELVIYEMHVRGFTIDPSSGVERKGSFAGIVEKIQYLKKLGINAVELMPIFEFDETKNAREYKGKQLLDYWGYNPVSFFAPNTSYSGYEEYNREGLSLKNMIKTLNENGIEVILDVVFNHTAEGNENGPYISFKGFDNNIYYLMTPEGYYYNFSGCGNTLNCNHPMVQNLIMDCLRYWVTEYRVDGFRFDLASILGRNEDGAPMHQPPLLQALAMDPILGKVKLIAEAWDAGGLYQVGSFPAYKRWSEWNGKYRDDMRRFLKGDAGMIQAAANRITGSRDLYDPEFRGTGASVNFMDCHDGFTLWDLYSYNEKHNEANGWNNSDGENNNNSWNCGVEGKTTNKNVIRLRKKMIKNAMTVLMMSRGIPMFLAGDEFGNTQFGNNNAYCQDNEISWLDWNLLKENDDLFQFCRYMIQLRKKHPVIYKQGKQAKCKLPDTSIHGKKAWYLDTSYESRSLGVLYAGRTKDNEEDDFVYLFVNAHWERMKIEIPKIPRTHIWRMKVNTDYGESCYHLNMPVVSNHMIVEGRSCIVLVGEKLKS